MLPVEILPVQETIVLRARGSELLILPHHVQKLKDMTKPRDFSHYFRAEALVNRPARKLFEAWLRKDHTLWPRLYQTVHKEMEAASDAPAPKKTAAKAKEAAEAPKAKAKAPKAEETPAKETKAPPKAPKKEEKAEKKAEKEPKKVATAKATADKKAPAKAKPAKAAAPKAKAAAGGKKKG